jgi:hypothetical protein
MPQSVCSAASPPGSRGCERETRGAKGRCRDGLTGCAPVRVFEAQTRISAGHDDKSRLFRPTATNDVMAFRRRVASHDEGSVRTGVIRPPLNPLGCVT